MTATVRDKSLLDLEASRPPGLPRLAKWQRISVRAPAVLVTWMREQAYLERVTMNRFILQTLKAKRDGGLPADVREWLTIQAAQCGCPGEPDRALVIVLRHLAERWPDGGRLA